MKIQLTAHLLRENGSNVLGTGVAIVKTAPTHSEAKALIDAEIATKVAAAQAGAQDLLDAQSAFNS